MNLYKSALNSIQLRSFGIIYDEDGIKIYSLGLSRWLRIKMPECTLVRGRE